jgi:hypothetical protein
MSGSTMLAEEILADAPKLAHKTPLHDKTPSNGAS